MIRLVIFAVVVVSCSAGHLGHNYNSRQSGSFPEKIENYPPLVNREIHTKSFYFFTAPEDDDVPAPTTNRVTSKVKKNLQVIVIKAPENNGYTEAALNLARQAIETKSVIYVLSKQPDLADLEKRIEGINSAYDQKPEVRFIKYRTSDDARRAQEAIKSLYDNVPGGSYNLNGLRAPVLDYTDSVDTTNDDDDLYTARKPPFLPTGVDVVPGSSYLPPKRD